MRQRYPQRRAVGRPRKAPAEKSRAKTLTLRPSTIAKMEAIRLHRAAIGDYRPPRSWMVQEGLALYFDKELQRFPELKRAFDDIDRKHNPTEQVEDGTRATVIRFSRAPSD